MSGIQANKRIDAGLKRGPRSQIDRRPQAALAQARNGQMVSTYEPERIKALLASVPQRIRSGETTTQIAAAEGIPHSTLKAWIIGDESVESARGQLIASELTLRMEQIDDAPDPLALGRAREGFRAWSWIAERRESRLYGQRLAVEKTVKIDYEDAGLLTSARELLDLFKAKREKVVESPQLQALDAPLSDSEHLSD